MVFLISWLETNAVLLGSLAAVVTIATLFLVNGTQIMSAFFFNPKSEGGQRAREGVQVFQSVTDRPSIAVLPLTVMASDPEIEHLADGIVEDVITQLARVPGFFVVARNSTFVYKNMAHDLRQIGRDLGVRYVVEGSLRVMGDNLRYTIQLIETETGDHVWASNSDVNKDNVMADPDRVSGVITASLQPQIMLAEALRAKKKPVEQLTVWELIHCAFSPLLLGFERDSGTAVSVGLARRAIAMDPENARAKAALAWSLANRATSNARPWQTAEMEEALQIGQEALRQDRGDSVVLYCWACVLVYARRTDEGISFLERALQVNPYDAQVLAFMGTALIRQGRREEGLKKIDEAMALSPEDPRLYMWYAYKSMGYFANGAPDKATKAARNAIQQHPVFKLAWTILAAAEAAQGHEDKAMEAVHELLRIDPEHSFQRSLDAYRDGAVENAPVPERMQPLVELLEKHNIDQ
ncbi:MAG: tetratricopeptide repeat protein [Alphaproteobacteria bacterium]|nr:MAG: tetratricopeptide repeat protein [Alphaproteobacteria bacterium]